MPADAARLEPGQHSVAGQVSPVVADNRRGVAAQAGDRASSRTTRFPDNAASAVNTRHSQVTSITCSSDQRDAFIAAFCESGR